MEGMKIPKYNKIYVAKHSTKEKIPDFLQNPRDASSRSRMFLFLLVNMWVCGLIGLYHALKLKNFPTF